MHFVPQDNLHSNNKTKEQDKMARITEIIEGNFGRANGELRQTQSGQYVFGFSTVVTPRRKVGNDWVDDESIWTECTIWGTTAKVFADAVAAGVVRGGTPLIMTGTRRARLADAYVNKNGQEVPARVEQSVNVDTVGIQFLPYLTITGTGKPDGTATPQAGGQSQQQATGNVFAGANAQDAGDIFGTSKPAENKSGDDPFSIF